MAYQHQSSRRYGRERQLHEAAWARRQLGHLLAVSNSKQSRREAGKTLYVARPSVTPSPRTISERYFSWQELRLQVLASRISHVLPFQREAVVPSTGPIPTRFAPPTFLYLERRNHGSHILHVTFQGRSTRIAFAPFPSLCPTQYGS